MSERRQARVRSLPAAVTEPGGVPRCLKVGRCIEVWDVPGVGIARLNARWRFSGVRRWWFDLNGITALADQLEAVALGAPWSVDYLTYRGQSERVGRSTAAIVAERLGAAGCTVDDLPTLAAEADELYALACLETDYRKAMNR